MVGAPVAVAQHVGPVDSETPMLPGVGWSTMFVGESQIVDAAGTILARLGPEDYDAIACAEVEIGPQGAHSAHSHRLLGATDGGNRQGHLVLPEAAWPHLIQGSARTRRLPVATRSAHGSAELQPGRAPSELTLDDLADEPVEEAMTANAGDSEAQLT